MPELAERFFWLYAQRVDSSVVSAINDIHHQFAAEWQECSLEWTACVEEHGLSDRLWLFRLKCGIGNEKLARRFNSRFREYIQNLPSRLCLSNRQLNLKRRSNLPIPLTYQPIGGWPNTDLGLHAVNDMYNGMLVTYTYHHGRHTRSPHLQTGTLRRLMSTIEYAWRAAACQCHSGTCPECSGDGCYSCFQQGCIHCGGTGWKDFSRWMQGGFKINYSTGFPIAEL